MTLNLKPGSKPKRKLKFLDILAYSIVTIFCLIAVTVAGTILMSINPWSIAVVIGIFAVMWAFNYLEDR